MNHHPVVIYDNNKSIVETAAGSAPVVEANNPNHDLLAVRLFQT
jgi:hypothetical protein